MADINKQSVAAFMSKLYKGVNGLVDMKSIMAGLGTKLTVTVIKEADHKFRFTFRGEKFSIKNFVEFIYGYFPCYTINEIHKDDPVDVTITFDKGMDNVVLIRDTLSNIR